MTWFPVGAGLAREQKGAVAGSFLVPEPLLEGMAKKSVLFFAGAFAGKARSYNSWESQYEH